MPPAEPGPRGLQSQVGEARWGPLDARASEARSLWGWGRGGGGGRGLGKPWQSEPGAGHGLVVSGSNSATFSPWILASDNRSPPFAAGAAGEVSGSGIAARAGQASKPGRCRDFCLFSSPRRCERGWVHGPRGGIPMGRRSQLGGTNLSMVYGDPGTQLPSWLGAIPSPSPNFPAVRGYPWHLIGVENSPRLQPPPQLSGEGR